MAEAVLVARAVAVLAAAVVAIIASGSAEGVITAILAVCVTTIQDLVDAATVVNTVVGPVVLPQVAGC